MYIYIHICTEIVIDMHVPSCMSLAPPSTKLLILGISRCAAEASLDLPKLVTGRSRDWALLGFPQGIFSYFSKSWNVYLELPGCVYWSDLAIFLVCSWLYIKVWSLLGCCSSCAELERLDNDFTMKTPASVKALWATLHLCLICLLQL